MTLVDVYDRRAAENPGEPALIIDREPYAGTTLTWSAVVDRSRAIAEKLRGSGVAPQSRCAVVMADHPDVVPTVLAVWRCGAVVVPVDGYWGESTTHTVLTHSRAAFMVDVVRASCDPLPAGRPAGPALPAGTAMISYTSGSTSDPKGVVLTHAQLCHAYEAGGRALVAIAGRRPGRFGVTMRMSGLGVLGMNYLFPAVLGATVVVLAELTIASVSGYWRSLRARDVDTTHLVPPLVELLNRAARDDADTGASVTCLSSGAPLPPTAQERFQKQFRATLLNVYGLTEVSFAAFFGDRDPDGSGTPSIGVPATVQGRLRAPDDVILTGPGDGELELTGPAMSCGYYDNDGANADLFRDGWLRTGDLVQRDAAGRYQILGRKKDVAFKGAFTVYLHEVEEVANLLPGVLETAAVRLDLPTGEDIGLLVRPDADAAADSTDIQRELERRLGRQRAPRRVVLTTQPIPRIGQLKIDRRAALAQWNTLTSA